MPDQAQTEALLAALYSKFIEAAFVLNVKHKELAEKLLARGVKKVDAIDPDACTVEGSMWVRATFSAPVAGIPADWLRSFKWRSPNNAAIIDDNGNWIGVAGYFREWKGFIEAAREHVYTRRIHEARL